MKDHEIEDFHMDLCDDLYTALFSALCIANVRIYPALFLFKQRVWYEVVRSAHCHCRRASFACLFRLVANGSFTFSRTSRGRIPGGIP